MGREALLARASLPSMLVETVTSLARSESAKNAEREGDDTQVSHPVDVEIKLRTPMLLRSRCNFVLKAIV